MFEFLGFAVFGVGLGAAGAKLGLVNYEREFQVGGKTVSVGFTKENPFSIDVK